MDRSEFDREPAISFTREAAARCTPEQFTAINNQLGDERKMRIMVGFELPSGYLYFIRYGWYNDQVHTIHGGIDPDGGIST
jgi:hypothetical protein